MGMNYNNFYPDAPKETSYEESLEYQDFVVDVLIKNLGLVISTYSSRSYQFNIGESRQGIEIKLDKRISPKGNVSIEVFEKSRASNDRWIKSGILREDNTWLYIQGNYDYIFIFSKRALRKIYEEKYKDKVWQPKPTIKTFLITFGEAQRICERLICVGRNKDSSLRSE